MAENKVVNTTQLDADLTTIANAIREKAGVSDALVFPDGFADVISGIASVPPNISALASGTIIITEQKSSLSITHGLGVVPNFYFVRAQEPFDGSADNSKIYTAYGGNIGGTQLEHLSYYTTGGYGTSQRLNRYLVSATTLSTMSATGFYYKPDCLYHWICGVFMEQ